MINELTISHYNILKGGEGRLEEISEAIKQLNTDICGILEAVGWQENEKFWKEYGKKIGFNYFKLSIANTKYNIAVFSKYPIEVTSITQGFKHTVLKVSFVGKQPSDINIFFVHFSPVSEDERLTEVETLLNQISPSDRVLIMGDLNSLSAHDHYNKDLLLNFFKKNNIKKYGQGELRYQVVSKLESSGFTDVGKLCRKNFDYTVPTSSNTDLHHSQKLRIDYAFVNNLLLEDCIDCKIIKGDEYEKASDHYPLTLKINLK